MLINEIKDDLREECGKLGEVKKILIFDVNAEVNHLCTQSFISIIFLNREMRRVWLQLLSRTSKQLISVYWQ